MTQPAAPAPQAGPQGTPTNQPPSPPPTPPAPAGPPPATPPWGDDANFDPARAWALIQNKQADLDRAKAKVAELTPYQQKAQELEDAAKTELQRAQDAAALAQKQAQDATQALLRHQVANREGKVLPAALADRLRGSTKEELEADADALLAAFPQAPAASGTPHTPVEALRPGAMPQPPAPDVTQQIAEARAKGDLMTVIALENSKLANIPKR